MTIEPSRTELFADFLKELQQLDDFRSEYARRYQFEGLGRQDQDVQRLIEAMAFYSARTRGSAERAMNDYRRRSLQSLFPYLLSPMPAMALLYPVLGHNMQESRFLPAGAELSVEPSAASGVAPRAFRTLRDLEVFPLHIVERSVHILRKTASQLAGALPQGARGWLLSFEVAASARAEVRKRYYDDPQRPLRELIVHLNPCGDLLMATRLFDGLRRSCVAVRCLFMSDRRERAKLETTKLVFGLGEAPTPELENPIHSLRQWLHFPQSELCFRLPMVGAPPEWDVLRVELVLQESWPGSLSLGDNSFLLNAVPIENARRATAEPIEVDGSRLRYPILPSEPRSGMQVQEVLGVYLADPNTPGARTALFPSLLVEGGYALDLFNSDGHAWLEVDGDLDATSQPRTLHVEAQWFQSDQELPPPGACRVATSEHDLGPVVWALADPAVACQCSALASSPSGLNRLLELHAQVEFSAPDIARLLEVLGAGSSSIFARVSRYLKRVESSIVPGGSATGGAVRAYDMELSKVPPLLVAPLRLLLERLPRALALWTGEEEVVVSARFAQQSELPALRFEWREKHE